MQLDEKEIDKCLVWERKWVTREELEKELPDHPLLVNEIIEQDLLKMSK